MFRPLAESNKIKEIKNEFFWPKHDSWPNRTFFKYYVSASGRIEYNETYPIQMHKTLMKQNKARSSKTLKAIYWGKQSNFHPYLEEKGV